MARREFKLPGKVYKSIHCSNKSVLEQSYRQIICLVIYMELYGVCSQKDRKKDNFGLLFRSLRSAITLL